MYPRTYKTNRVAYNNALLKCCPDWLRLTLNRESFIPVLNNPHGKKATKMCLAAERLSDGNVEAEIGSTYTGKCWCHSAPLFKFGTGTHGICIWKALVHAFNANLTT